MSTLERVMMRVVLYDSNVLVIFSHGEFLRADRRRRLEEKLLLPLGSALMTDA